MNNKVVITIARQYGSGGRTVGEMLSKDMGIHYYDKELIKLASEESGINERLFVNADEKIKMTKLFKMVKNIYTGQLIPPESDDFVSDKNLFNYQAKVIKNLAEEESCVEQAAKKVSMPSKELEKYIAKIDKRRADYYKFYTGREWTDARNYDLCLDSSKLGFERCVEEIKAYIKVRFHD